MTSKILTEKTNQQKIVNSTQEKLKHSKQQLQQKENINKNQSSQYHRRVNTNLVDLKQKVNMASN